MNTTTNVKMSFSTMPWEIDHLLLTYNRIRNSLTHINSNVKIHINSVLNLSNFVIDWEKSTLPKEYFIDKFNAMEYYFKDLCSIESYIYTGNAMYGCLDIQRESYQENIDYYINICSDMNFNEHFITHIIEAAKQLTNKYFVISPQIYKCWDSSWDILVNKKFMSVPYEKCFDRNSNEIIKLTDDVIIRKLRGFKFAGWAELYNKAFYEKLVPVLDSWHGYGPWDLYAMSICFFAQNANIDVVQYVLENQIVWSYDSGTLKNENEHGGSGKLRTVYDNYVTKKMNKQDQRSSTNIDFNLSQLLDNWVKYYNENLCEDTK